MVRILLSGATGFIGKPLLSFLASKGHSVIPLARSASCDPEGFDAVIHLAGEPLTLGRWSLEKREKIFASRSEGTLLLTQKLAGAKRPPSLFISASAIGYYGDRGEELLTEESSLGSGFLADVCAAWERGSLPLEKRGCRVVHARFGMVLDSDGGALKKMLTPFKLGLGGKLGSGKQWVSWIHRRDLIRALDHILNDPYLNGPVNVVSPNPVRQEEFAKILAELLQRPHFFNVPAWALRLLLGIAADELVLSSAKVKCTKLLDSKFAFDYPDLRSALYKVLHN